MMQFQKNARTEERTERQTLFDTTLPTTTGGQKKTLFMDGVHASQGCRAATRRQFTFYQ